MLCKWFLLCENEATGTTPHPVLGDVPTCDRCHTFATDKVRETITARGEVYGIEYTDDDEAVLESVYGRDRPEVCINGHSDCATVEGGPCAAETYARLVDERR